MKTFFYRHNKGGVAPVITPHKLTYCELTFVLKGTLFYRTDGQTVTVRANEGILLKSGMHREREQADECDYISFNFTDDAPPDLPVHIGNIPYEIKLLLGVCDEFQKNYPSYENKITDVLSLLLDTLRENNDKKAESPVVSKIKKYIRENLHIKLTLKRIAAVVGYTPNYCDYLFRKETGSSLIHYAICERITEAKRLLLEGILPLNEIALAVGFEDYNYFSRTFKKHEGVNPSAFKISK